MINWHEETPIARERATLRKRTLLRTSTWLLALGAAATSAALAACSSQGTTQAGGGSGGSAASAPSGPASGGGSAQGGAGGISAGAGGQTTMPMGGVGGSAGASGGGAGSTGGSTGTGGQAGAAEAGVGDAGEAGADPVASCVAALKPRCQMRETAACSSFLTVDVGTLVKATEFAFGPYGAIMEYNVGKGFEVPKDPSEDNCASIAASFGEPADVTANTVDLKDVDLTLYTVYRPACMREGETYPVITWGNGTCGQTEGYGALLRYIASYGYVVFASNSRWTAGNGAMTKALDFAASANKDSKSVYYNRLDMTKVGAMGHSQGGTATVNAASDSRVSSLIIWNASTSASKPFLAVSGDNDLTNFTPTSMARDINASSQPSAWLYYHKVPKTGSVSGHLTLMIQPERVVEPARAWWDYMLKGDTKARDLFLGTSCGLCGKAADLEYGEKGLK